MRLLPLLALLPATLWAAELADTSAQRAAAAQLLGKLSTELKQEIAKNGPVSAIAVCRDIAPKLAGDASRETGWKVSRVSLKPRNPLLGMADAWEQDALLQLEKRLAAGEKPELLDMSAIVQEPAGRYLRYAKAIPVQPVCLMCHGDSKAIPAEVRKQLETGYPHDRATGYSAGQLRGAVSIKVPLPE